MADGIYSGEDVSDHTIHVRFVRQHVPGDYRYRFPLESKHIIPEEWRGPV